jgi:hypothetical protein
MQDSRWNPAVSPNFNISVAFSFNKPCVQRESGAVPRRLHIPVVFSDHAGGTGIPHITTLHHNAALYQQAWVADSGGTAPAATRQTGQALGWPWLSLPITAVAG